MRRDSFSLSGHVRGNPATGESLLLSEQDTHDKHSG